MKLVQIKTATVPLQSDISNAWVNFREMTGTVVAVVSDVRRHGYPVIGWGFGSIGRYSSTAIVRGRIAPRLLACPPSAYLDADGRLDPMRAWPIMLQNEKPGGHGERSTAVGAVDMALWDLAAKLEDVPLWKLLSDRFNQGRADTTIAVYAAGGYYHQAGGQSALQDEIKGYREAGYTDVKIKIGGATLAEDLKRVECAVQVMGGMKHVAVDANGRLDATAAHAYATALGELGVRWFEEPGDPLDFAMQAELSASHPALAFATGENLFSHQDVRNLCRHAGLNSKRDTLQMDPALSYGLPEYLRMLDLLATHGWSRRRCVPHGGHQFSLHLAAGLQLGGNESYPGVFKPFGGFADDTIFETGLVRLPDAPGIGIELQRELSACFRGLLG